MLRVVGSVIWRQIRRIVAPFCFPQRRAALPQLQLFCNTVPKGQQNIREAQTELFFMRKQEGKQKKNTLQTSECKIQVTYPLDPSLCPLNGDKNFRILVFFLFCYLFYFNIYISYFASAFFVTFLNFTLYSTRVVPNKKKFACFGEFDDRPLDDFCWLASYHLRTSAVVKSSQEVNRIFSLSGLSLSFSFLLSVYIFLSLFLLCKILMR